MIVTKEKHENRDFKRAIEILRKASAHLAQAGSTADRGDGDLHRRASGTLRARADLRRTADRPCDLLRAARPAERPDAATRPSTAYSQPLHPSFYLEESAPLPPRPVVSFPPRPSSPRPLGPRNRDPPSLGSSTLSEMDTEAGLDQNPSRPVADVQWVYFCGSVKPDCIPDA